MKIARLQQQIEELVQQKQQMDISKIIEEKMQEQIE